MQFYEPILSYFLNKHHVMQIQSQNLVSLLFIIYYLELISLTLDFDEIGTEVPLQINLLYSFDYLRKMCKPYVFLQDYEEFRLYCFLLPTFLLLFQLIGLIIDQFFKKIVNRIIQISKQQRKDYRIFETEKLLSFLFQIYQYIFSLYSIDLFLISILETQDTHPVIMTFCIIFLVIELVFVFLNIICSQSIHFNSSPLHVTQPSKLYTLSYILIIFSILISTSEADWADLIRYSLNLIVFGIHLKFEIKKQTSDLEKLVLIILSLGFLYNFSGLVLQDGYKQEQTAVVFIFTPFLVNFLTKLQCYQNRINFASNRTLEEIYNNLLLLQQSKITNTINQLDILIMLRMKSDFGQDPFDSELLLFNDKIINSQNSLKSFWYLKYIAIKVENMKCYEALTQIFYLKQNFLYNERKNQYFKVYFQLSFIQSLQLEKIKLEVYDKLYYITIKNYHNMSRFVSNFINYKIQIAKTQNELLEILSRKEKIYQQMAENKNLAKNTIFYQSQALIKQALETQKDLKLQLLKNKTYRIQQLCILFYVEIFNNIFQAELMKNKQMLNEEVKQNSLENQELLGMRINDEREDIALVKVSQDFLIQLGYKRTKKIDENMFKSFFPYDFLINHQCLVTNFLKTGKNKLLEETSEILIRGCHDIYYKTQFQLTVQTNDDNGLQFYGFMKIFEEQPKILLVTKSKIIVGCTTSFLKLLESLNISTQNLILSDVRKLIRNYSYLKLNKYDYLHFFESKQEFTVFLKEKMNLIELQLTEGHGMLTQEEESQVDCQYMQYDLNEESEVIIPKNSSLQDVLSQKLTMTKRNQTKEIFLKSDTKQFLIIKSEGEIKQNSQPSQEGIQQLNSKLGTVKNNNKDIEQASSKFSRGFQDHSIYFAKYSNLDQFVSTVQRKKIYLFVIFLIIGVFVNFIFQVVSIASFIPQYKMVIQDADALSVQAYFITPIHSCLVSEFGTLYYNLYKKLGLINEEVLINQIQFTQDSVFKSFDFLRDSFMHHLSNYNLQHHFTDTYLEILQVDGNVVKRQSLPLKNALMYIYQAQYFILKENFKYDAVIKINEKIQLSNNLVYYMANVVTIDDYFDNISQQILESVQDRSRQLSNNYTVYYLKLSFLQMMFLLLASFCLVKIFLVYKNYFQLFSNVNVTFIRKELHQTQKLKQLLESDNAYQNYNFEVKSWEKEVQTQQSFFNQKANQQNIVEVNYQPPLAYLIILVLLILVIFLLPITVLQIISQNYFEYYYNTCKLLQQISEISSSIPAVYELKDTIYQINKKSPYYFYVDELMASQYLLKVLSEQDKIKTFIQSYTQIDFDTLLISDQFLELYSDLSNSSLCNYLVHYSEELALPHCDIAYNGVMKLGLISTISEIYKQVYQEYVNTEGFKAKYRTNPGPYQELEIALISSNVLVKCQQQLYNDIINLTDQMVSVHSIINYTYIFVNIIAVGIILKFFYPYLLQQQKIIRHMIFLVPKYQFYLDSKFETDFRLLVIKQI